MYKFIDNNGEYRPGFEFRATVLDTESGKRYVYSQTMLSSGGLGWVTNEDGSYTEKVYDILTELIWRDHKPFKVYPIPGQILYSGYAG